MTKFLHFFSSLLEQLRSGCATNSNCHCERKQSNLAPTEVPRHEIASARDARLAMTGAIGRNLVQPRRFTGGLTNQKEAAARSFRQAEHFLGLEEAADRMKA